MRQHSVMVGPHTIEWCLYVMTPQLKPDYPKVSDIITPLHLHPFQFLLISDHLEVTKGHSLQWVQWSHWLLLLLLHGPLWPTPSPCSCHLELTHHRDSTVPTSQVLICWKKKTCDCVHTCIEKKTKQANWGKRALLCWSTSDGAFMPFKQLRRMSDVRKVWLSFFFTDERLDPLQSEFHIKD